MSLRLARGVACAVVLAAGLAIGTDATALTTHPAVPGASTAPRNYAHVTVAVTHGLRGAYAPSAIGDTSFVRVDPRPDFDWRRALPRTGFSRSGFVVRWAGSLSVPRSGLWRLELRVRGAGTVTLYAGARRRLGASVSQSPPGSAVRLTVGGSRSLTLRTGHAYALLMTFRAPARTGGSVALLWARDHGPLTVVPSRALIPAAPSVVSAPVGPAPGTPAPVVTTATATTPTGTSAAPAPTVSTSAPPPATTPDPPTTTTSTGPTTAAVHPPFGGNVNGVADYSPDFMFVDAMLSAGSFYALDSYGDGPDLNTPATVDAKGWPTEDFSFYVNEIAPESGTYTVEGIDTAAEPTVALHLTEGTVGTMSYDPGTGAFSVPVTVDAANDDPDSTVPFILVLTHTSGGVQNLHVIRPGYDPDDPPVFTTSFLDEIKANDPGTLRAMDLAATNANVVSSWSDRTQPDGSQAEQLTATVPWDGDPQTVTEPKGLAWEYIADLANATQTNLWVNVPVLADDNYVTQLATLLKGMLDPNLSVYVEYSNELWNYGFPNGHENAGLAEQDYADGAGDTTLAYDGTDIYTMATLRQAERTVQISNLFKSVWGPEDSRVHTVLAGQYANPFLTDEQLQYIAAEFGPPRDYISDIAAAPYVAVPDDTDLTDADVLSDLSTAIDTMQSSGTIEDWRTEAGAYGLGLAAYEGGFDTYGPNSIDAKAAAMHDPAIQSLVETYLTDWYADGGGLFNWYTLGTGTFQTQYGDWSITDDQSDLTEPKELGVQDIAAGPAITPTAGALLPAQIDGRDHSFEHGVSTDPTVRYLGSGATFDYLVRAPSDGTYPLSVLTTESDPDTPNAPLAVSVDGTAVGIVTTDAVTDAAITGSDAGESTSLSLNLTAGLHTIRLVSPDARPFNIDSLLLNDAADPVAFGSASEPLLPRMDDFEFYQDQTVNPGTSWSNTFTVADSATPAGQLTVTASSDNQSVIGDGDISVSNDNGDVSFTVTANPGHAGTADVVFTVTDAAGLRRQTEIVFTVPAAGGATATGTTAGGT